MSLTVLIECSPRRPADGVIVPLRLVFKSVARANFLAVQWNPSVVAVPAFEASLGFDGRQFGAAPSPQIGDLVFALTSATRFAASLVWTNATVTMKAAAWTPAGGDPADADFATIWTGQAEDIATGNGEARVRLLDNGQALRVAALAGKFGSTGDALLDGADALKDRSAETRVPRAWGKLLSIPALLVDRANNIWLFAGNAATSVQGFYDGGAAFAMGTARANLAALQANTPASGAVDYCLDASGKFLARPWTAPTYPFTAAATFGSATAANIASAIVTGRTAVTFAAGTVSAFNTLQGADCGLYLDDDTSVASALDRLFSGLGAWWRLSSAGTITLGRWAWSTPTLTVAAHRRHAPERLRVLAPTRRRSLGYARNDRVHSESEIARILLAGDLTYANGTTIEALKPAEVAATNTAAPNVNRIRFSRFEGGASVGWGQWNPSSLASSYGVNSYQEIKYIQNAVTATASGQYIATYQERVGIGRFRVQPNERLSIQARVQFYGAGAGTWTVQIWWFRGDGSTYNATTGIAGSAPVYIGNSSPFYAFLTVPTDAVAAGVDFYGISGAAGFMELSVAELMVSSATAAQTIHPAFVPGPSNFDGADVTLANTAAAITGQSGWATYNTMTPTTVAGRVSRLQFDGQLEATDIYKTGIASLSARWPDELGANKTETRTAAAFTGQSAWATYSDLAPTTVRNKVGLLDPDGYMNAAYVVNPGVAYLSGVWPQELGANRTETRTAAAFTGQGAWATYSALAPVTVENKIGLLQGDGYMNAAYVVNPGVAYLVSVWPAELGANKTETRTAASIIGQGALATRNSVDFATEITGVPSGFGQQTVGNAQVVQKWMSSGQSIAVSGAHGATTGSYGNRSATLLANGSVFATGSAFLVAPSEPNYGEVSGTYTHSGASALVSFSVSYSGAAYTIDTTKIFCRA